MDKQSEKFILSLYKYDNEKNSYSAKKGKSIKNTWSLTFDDNQSKEKYITCFGLGYVKYYLKNEIDQECIQYVPMQDSLKISILKLKNNLNEDICLKVKYDLKLQIGENYEDKRFIVNIFKESLNMNLFKNIKNNSGYVYVTSNEKINENNEVEINLKKNEEKEVLFIIGCEENEDECLDRATKYLTNYKEELENTKKYWREKTSRIYSNTPMKSFDFMQNNWLVYQTIVSRINSRSGFYQASRRIWV